MPALAPGLGRQGERGIMVNKISPTFIGAFVVGAIVCMVAGALLFGGGKFFAEKVPYVMFFERSVEGLNVGAPVIFRGVQVGQVTEISAIADPQTFDVRIKVQVELVRGVIKVGEEGQHFKNHREGVQRLIQKGARASLRMQSFVTGLLYVAIDFYPDTPITLLGLDPAHTELPTIPSDMDQLKATLQETLGELKKLPLEALFSEVLGMLKRANTLLETPELKQTLVSLYDVVEAAQRLLRNADGQVSPLGTKLGAAADAARVTLEMARTVLADAQKLLRNVDGQVTPLAGNANDTLAAARGTLGQAQKSLVKLTDTASPALKQAEQTFAGADAVIHNDLAQTLRALEEAVRAIRALANTLDRRPEALLRGK
jgi:paraquat-inducible protein B